MQSKLKLFLVPAFLAVWVPGPASAASSAPPADLTATFGETIDVDVLNVDVFVTGRDGKPATGLKKGDFQVLEDGKPVEISNFQELRSRQAAEGASGFGGSVEAVATDTRQVQGPNYIAIYFDDANIQPSHRARMVQQLRAFLAENVRPVDRVLLASYDLGLKIDASFTADREVLGAALDRLSRRATSGGQLDRERSLALRTMVSLQALNGDPEKGGNPCSSEVKSPVESYALTARHAALHSINGLKFLVNSLSGVPGRKSLLLVSDGIPLTPGEELNEAFIQMCAGGAVTSGAANRDSEGNARVGDAPVFDMRGTAQQVYTASVSPLDMQKYSVASDLDALAAHANSHRVSIYSLQASGAAPLASSSAALDGEQALLRIPEVARVLAANYEGALSSLSSATGGKAIFHANQIAQDLGGLWNDLSTHYSIGIAPGRKGDGRQHRIEIKVKQPGLRVRHLQSYRDKPVLEQAVDRTLAALLYDIEENPLGVTLEIDPARPGDKGLYTVAVRLRIPLFKLAILNRDKTFVGSLRLLVATQSPSGAVSPVRQVEVPLNIPEAEVLRALGQFYVYNLTLQMKAGEQRVALAVRDEVAGATSFLARALSVGTAAPATAATAAAN